jgi:hypothetical protein
MTRSAVSVIAAMMLVSPGLSHAATDVAVKRQLSAQATDPSGRRHHMFNDAIRNPPPEARYYARPFYYRPYPYGVPDPFVLGFGPWW